MATLIEELIEYGGWLLDTGFAVGQGGSVSVRLEDPGFFLITPTGLSMSEVGRKDHVKLSLATGEVVDETVRRPSIDWRAHLEIYKTRFDVNAITVAYPITTMGLLNAGIEIRPTTPWIVRYTGRTAVIDYARPDSGELAKAVAAAAKNADVVLVRNMGVFAFGNFTKQAFYRMQSLEQASRSQLASIQAGGKLTCLTDEQVAEIRSIE